jgi:hypothetical protein
MNEIQEFDEPNTDRIIIDYFKQVGDVVNICRNLEDLSVISVESQAVTFWDHVLPQSSKPHSILYGIWSLAF